MKTNFAKYIFFLIVILLIGLSVYILYKDKDKQKDIITEKKAEITIDTNLNIGIINYDTINPVLSTSKDVQYLSVLIYDSLLKMTPDFKIEGGLAEEWSAINEKAYLIKLKNNIKWHDGTDFTSKDVKFTIEGLKNLKTNSIYKKNVATIQRVEIIDEHTIKIHLKKDTPFFEYMLCFPILSESGYKKDTLASKTNTLIGTGMYKISKDSKKEIVLEKVNKQSDLKFDKITVKVYKSAIELYNNLSRENIDLISTENIYFEKYIGTVGFNIYVSTDREFDYLAINTKDTVLSNKEVRQAINYAIDKSNIVYNEYNNQYFVSEFPLDNGNYLYNSDKIDKGYNISKAKKALENNGWVYKQNTWSKLGVTYDLKVNLMVDKDDINRVLVAENIKEQLDKIGIKINIQKIDKQYFNNYIKYNNYDLILTGNRSPICPNLTEYLGKDNLSNYSNEKINGLLKEINKIQDEEILKEKYEEIIEEYSKEMPFISLYFNSNILISNSKIKGNMEHNWNNIFYNINSWYKVI